MDIILGLVFPATVIMLFVGIALLIDHPYPLVWLRNFFRRPWSYSWGYNRVLKTGQKIIYTKIKMHRRITRCLFLTFYKIKFWCILRAPFVPIKIRVPDEIISNLSPGNLVFLVMTTIGKKGQIYHLQYNLELVAQKLTPLALTDPDFYSGMVGSRLSSAVKRHLEHKGSRTVQSESENKACLDAGEESGDKKKIRKNAKIKDE